MVQGFIISLLVLFLIIIISALPLHIAVKLMNGRTHLLKTILVMFITSLIITIISTLIPFGAILAFIILIWLYREIFRLKWYKAFIVWLLQIIFISILVFIVSIVGISFTIFTIVSPLIGL